MAKFPSFSRIVPLLFLLLGQPLIASASASETGDSLNQRGFLLLDQGRPDKALEAWQKAHDIYEASQDSSGINGTLLNQSLALQDLGQYYSACTVLAKILTLNYKICQSGSKSLKQHELNVLPSENSSLEPDQQVIAYNNLGNVLRLLGQLKSSEVILEQALINTDILDPGQRTTIELSLANTYYSRYRQAHSQLSISSDPQSQHENLETSKTYASGALNLYQKLFSKRSDATIQAQINGLELIQHLQGSDATELNDFYLEKQSLTIPLIKTLLDANFTTFAPTEAIQLQLKLSELLIKLDSSTTDSSLSYAFRFAKAALDQANDLDNFRLQSQALGTIGRLYLHAEQLDDAVQVLTKALTLAQSVNDNELAYEWSWQLAQIHRERGQFNQAISTYSSTLQYLDKVRATLVSANANLQFNYAESIEPVYHEYLELLLASPSPDLHLVLQTHQQLQLAELENYLKCGKLEVASVVPGQNTDISGKIHIFKLNNQIEVILQTQDGTFVRHRPDLDEVEQGLFNLLTHLEDNQFHNISEFRLQQKTQVLYEQLIRPLQQYLPESGTLAFNLDSHFQNLPISLLHDGSSYLIQNYSVQTTLQTQLRSTKRRTKDLKVLFAGLTESPRFRTPGQLQNLPPLPDVEDELKGVQEHSQKTIPLLNREFTKDRLQTSLNRGLPIVHLASHGQFSSDPERTMIATYNGPINAREFHELLNQKNELGQAAIELLILSACQTAKGDRRSALGIAGLAVQAGSQNIVASLWLVDSKATSQLITVFYQELNNGSSKAAALRQAQLSLLKSDEYSHPYFWGSMILVGS